MEKGRREVLSPFLALVASGETKRPSSLRSGPVEMLLLRLGGGIEFGVGACAGAGTTGRGGMT